MKNTITTRPEYVYEKPTHGLFKDLTGKKFSRLLVDSFAYRKLAGKTSNYRIYYNCICECGAKIIVSGNNLGNGHTSSCGCYHDEKRKTHGLSKHPLYKRCHKYISKCHNVKDEKYKIYGARGIEVFENWRNDIPLMIKEIESEIGLPPSKDHEIDRINNNEGYKPGNLRWVLGEPNCRNRRTSHDHARDPITRKSTPTYYSWNKMNRNKGEVCKEWLNDNDSTTTNGFQKFLEDMGEKKGTLKRYDKAVSFCKENCYWG